MPLGCNSEKLQDIISRIKQEEGKINLWEIPYQEGSS